MSTEKLILISIILAPVFTLLKFMIVPILDLKKAAKFDSPSIEEIDRKFLEEARKEESSKPSRIFAFIDKKYGFLVPIVIYGLAFYVTQITYPNIISSTPIYSILLIIVVAMSIHSFFKSRNEKYKNKIIEYKESGRQESSYANQGVIGLYVLFDLLSIGFLNFIILNLFLNFSINFLSVLSLLFFAICFCISRSIKRFVEKCEIIAHKKQLLFNSKHNNN